MQDGRKEVWSIPYVSLAFFPSLKHNFIAYRSSKVSSRPDCIFKIHHLCQSDFSRVYSNSCCSCSLEPEIIKIGESSHKMCSNNIVNFQESTTILNACTKKSGNLLNEPRARTCVYVCVCCGDLITKADIFSVINTQILDMCAHRHRRTDRRQTFEIKFNFYHIIIELTCFMLSCRSQSYFLKIWFKKA